MLDFVKQVGGSDIADRYEKHLKNNSSAPGRRAVWVGNSGPASIDRATAMLPKLYLERLDDAGIDYGSAMVLRPLGFSALVTMSSDL